MIVFSLITEKIKPTIIIIIIMFIEFTQISSQKGILLQSFFLSLKALSSQLEIAHHFDFNILRCLIKHVCISYSEETEQNTQLKSLIFS